MRYLSGNVGLGCLRNALRPDEQRHNNVIMGSPKHYNYPSDDLVSAYNNNGTAENPDKRKAVTLKELLQRYDRADGRGPLVRQSFLSPITSEYDGENDWPVLRG